MQALQSWCQQDKCPVLYQPFGYSETARLWTAHIRVLASNLHLWPDLFLSTVTLFKLAGGVYSSPLYKSMVEYKSVYNCVQNTAGIFLEARVIFRLTMACVSTKTSLILSLFHWDVRHSYNEHLYLETVQIMCLELAVMQKAFLLAQKNVLPCKPAECSASYGWFVYRRCRNNCAEPMCAATPSGCVVWSIIWVDMHETGNCVSG